MKPNKMIENGVSVCAKGEENYEHFEARRDKWFYQYDYRHTDGELFSIVLPTLEKCRDERDLWLSDKLLRNSERQEIRQNGETVLYSNHAITMGVIFNNLTGKNSKTAEDYRNYVQYVALPQMGFIYGEIELVADGETVRKGHIRENL